MEILPSSTIWLIRDCPLTNSYKDTIYFADPEEQHNHFVYQYPNVYYNNVSYQRYACGVITLKGVAEELYDVNYMMFQNTGFGNKWFYAFVNLVEYVNNRSVRIHYQIDVIQTWMFDYTKEPCLIVRNHTKTDTPGENLTSENFGDMDYTYTSKNYFGGEWVLVVQTRSDFFLTLSEAVEPLTEIIEPGVYGGTLVDSNFYFFYIDNHEDALKVITFLRALKIATLDDIVATFMMPLYFASRYAQNNYYRQDVSFNVEESRPLTLDGHIPKNKKLLTAPYVEAFISNNIGNEKTFSFEMFGGTATFRVGCGIGVGKSPYITVDGVYNGDTNNDGYAILGMPLQTVPIASTKFVDWFSANSVGVIGYLLGSLPATASVGGYSGKYANSEIKVRPNLNTQKALPSPSVGLMSVSKNTEIAQYNPYGQLPDFRESITPQPIELTFPDNESYSSILGMLTSMQQYKAQTVSSPNALFGSINSRALSYGTKTIRAYQAKIIDDYFTVFGYAIGTIELPSFNNRPYYTYIRTQGFSGHGSVPCDDMRAICSIHDSGITYWKNTAVVGDYTQNNTV